MSYTGEMDHFIIEIKQTKIILEGLLEQIVNKPKFNSVDYDNLTNIFQTLTNTITNAVSELQKSELRYKEIYENSPVLYRTANYDGIIIHCNIRYANRFGCTKEEIVGTSIFDCVEDDQVGKMKKIFETWKKKGQVSNEEIWLKTKFGAKFPALMNVSNLYDLDGNVIGTNTVLQDISDVYLAKKASEEKIRLDAKIKELEKSNKLRQELLSIVKHEFRTPLTPIKGYCEMLLEQSNENLTDLQQTSLNGIFRGIQKFEVVVDKVLDLQALETDMMIFKEEVISVSDFMGGIAGDFSKTITQSGIEFINSSNCVGEIKGDALKLRDVFNYIINNAMDFVPEETGKIEIGSKANEESVIFYVKNNGPEIPRGELQNIFAKFYQVDSSKTRRHQGMGLGLAICKEIIEKLGGKIWCESEEGKGASFYFTLKKAEKN